MSDTNTFNIDDKVVLTKTANTLTVFANQNETTEVVNINAYLVDLKIPSSGSPIPPSGSEPPVTKINVFFDGFNVSGSDLPGTGSLNEKAAIYVSNIWNLTLK